MELARKLPRYLVACVALVCVVGLQCAAGEPSPPHNPRCRQTKVVILGGGMAGVTAAQALTNASITDFLIVEYLDNLGGRVAHTNFGAQADGTPYTVELGANWVQARTLQNGHSNPIWLLAMKYNLNTTRSKYYGSLQTFDHTGPVNYHHLFKEFVAAAAAYLQHPGHTLAQSLKDISVRSALTLVGWRSRFDPHRQAAEWYGFDFEYAATPEESSAAYAISGYGDAGNEFAGDAGGDHFVHDSRGYSTIVRGEAANFLDCSPGFDCSGDPRLLLNTIVTGISYSDTGVTVDTADGQCIAAEYAICTFSVGVLQHDVVAFSPRLPEWKRLAIASITMATYTKIFLQFPASRVFWDTNTQFFLYADPVQRGYYPAFQSLDGTGFLPGSGILFVTVVTDQSYAVEAQSDAATKAQVLAVLRAMFGAHNVPEPTAFMYPRWSMQPWAYGSYSNWPPGTRLAFGRELRRNVSRVHFAGEATSPEDFGLLQGAYLEGQKAGKKIAKYLHEMDQSNQASGR